MTPTWIDVFLDVPRQTWDDAVERWSALTGWAPSARRGENGQFVTLTPSAGTPWLKMQAYDGGPRVHLDLASTDRAALLRRADDLGAEPAWQYHDVPVLTSPGGLLLCLTNAPASPRMARGAPSILDQVVLDIPARLWDREIAFWRDLTGREVTHGRSDDYARLVDPDPAGAVRFLLQRLASDQPSVTAHVDFAVADREAERRRHTSLGSEVVAEQQAWTVLRTPEGVTYCLTDRDPLTGVVR